MIIENKKKWSIFLILLIFLPSFLLADQGQCQRGGWIYPNYEKGVFDPFESFNSGLSYINISGGLELNPDGSITLSVPLTQFEALALYKQFAPSFQVFFSPSFSNSTFETILSSDVTTATCAENLARFVFDYRFAIDGIIFDWEPGSTLPPADQQQRYVCLCKQISKEFPDFFIPVRAFFDQRPRTDQFKITELSYVLDAFELQSYQLAFPGTGLQLTIDKWLELGLNPKQILLGIGITSTESSNVYIGEN
ncbi:MAG: hypothetical protein KDK56_04015, partial [Simkania sp.]|nr:hypothetical protein [Simkania sp.]